MLPGSSSISLFWRIPCQNQNRQCFSFRLFKGESSWNDGEEGGGGGGGEFGEGRKIYLCASALKTKTMDFTKTIIPLVLMASESIAHSAVSLIDSEAHSGSRSNC